MNGKLFMLFMAFCLLLPSIHYTGLASQTVIPRELFIYAFSIVFVIAIAGAETLRYNRFYLFSLLFLLWQLITLAWSSDLKAGLEAVLNAYFFLLISFVFFQMESAGRKQALMLALISSIAFSCLLGLWQNFYWNPLGIYQAEAPSSTYVNKNLAASASLLFLPLTLTLMLQSESRALKLALSLAGALILSFILVSHTKGVWLAGIVLSIIAFAVYRFSNDRGTYRKLIGESRYHLGFIAGVAILLFALPGVRNLTVTAPLPEVSVSSGSLRLGFYADALKLVRESPLAGIGTGSFRREFRSIPGGDYRAQHASQEKYLSRLHNDHLQVLVEQGLIGLLLWACVIGALYLSTFRFLRDRTIQDSQRLLVFSLLLGVTGMLIHALFSFPLRSVSTASLFWICSGLLFSYQGCPQRDRVLVIKPALRYSTVPALLLVCVLAINGITKNAIASYLQQASWKALSKGNCFAAKTYLKSAVENAGMDLRSAQLMAVAYDLCPYASPAEALSAMDSVLAYEPDHSRALLVKGNVYAGLGRQAEADRYYRQTLLVNPSEVRAYIGLARIHLAEKRYADARHMAEEALAIDGENRDARELLSAIPQ